MNTITFRIGPQTSEDGPTRAVNFVSKQPAALAGDPPANRAVSQEWDLPKVSIVITCYNHAHYLREAIESALAQYYPNTEVLVLDDGSTDNTADVAAEFPAVRYLRQSNRGLSAARNAGLYVSKGDFITFLDADDRLMPDAVGNGIDCFDRHPNCAFVYGDFRNVGQDGTPLPTRQRMNIGGDHYAHLLRGNFIGMHGTVLYRRAALVDANGFDDTLPACEDYDMYLRIARTQHIAGYPSVAAEYRQHGENMSKDRSLMLDTVLLVLKRQRKDLPSGRYRKPLREGIQAWTDYYMPSARSIRYLQPASIARSLARRTLSLLPEWLKGRVRARIKRLGRNKMEPVSRQFGFDRGQPIDRYYIEAFLAENTGVIRGCVLEIGDDSYSRRFGAGKVTQQDVLHNRPGHPGVTVVADLSNAPDLPSNRYDCVILTQTLHYIFDLDAAVATIERILKPGGTVLVSVPGISQVCMDQEDKESDCWRFTEPAARRLFRRHFGLRNVAAGAHGNLVAATGFLQGLCVSDLEPGDLEHRDPRYPLVITLKAVKPCV